MFVKENEKEITVKLKWNLNETKVHFVNAGFVLDESYILKDVYMVKDNLDISRMNNTEIISNCIIIREAIGEEHTHQIVYKHRKYDDKGDIVDSVKYKCAVFDVNEAIELLKVTGYKELFRYEQECLMYNYKDSHILLQYIPELGLFAEIEDNNKNINGLIEDLNNMNVPYDEKNYFVKKASLMIDKMKKVKM